MATQRLITSATLGLLCVSMLAVVCAVWPPEAAGGYDRFAYPKELVIAAAGLPGLAIALVCWGWRWVERYDLWLVAFLALSVLSALVVAANPWLAWRSVALSLGSAGALWTARCLAARGYRAHLSMAAGVAVAVAAATVIAEAQGLTELSMRARSPGGTLGNRNFMAHLLVLGVPLLAAGALASRWRGVAVGHGVALSAVVHAIVLSHCRAAWLAMFALLPYLSLALWRQHRRGGAIARRRVLAVVAAAGVGLVTAMAVPNALRWRSEGHLMDSLRGIAEYESGTGRGRVIQYEHTLSMVSEHWALGVGTGNWSVGYPAFSEPGDPTLRARALQPVNRLPNSDWLGMASERGVFALLALLAFAVGLVLRNRTGWERRGDPLEVVIPATLLVAAIMGALDAVLLRPAPALVVAVIVGAHVPAPRCHSATVAADRRSSVLLRVGAAVVLLGLAASFVDGRVGDMRALHARIEARAHHARSPERRRTLEVAALSSPGDYRIRAMLAVLALDCERAVDHARATLRLYPEHAQARAVLARCPALARRDGRFAP